MKLHTNTGGPVATNGYLLADETTGEAAVIDAPHATVAPLLKVARHHGWDVKFLLLTHGHWDHVADHKVVTDAYPAAKVLIHPLDEPKLIKPVSIFMPLPFDIPPRKADAHIADGQVITVGNVQLEAMFTPGHSPGHIVFYIKDQSLLLAGDLLFAQSIGRTDLPDSSPADMARSLKRVLQLPDDTLVKPGHGPETTIGAERRSNPWLEQL